MVVVIIVIQSAMMAEQALQQLRLNENAGRKCNSIGDQLIVVVQVASGSTSTTITKIAGKSIFNGNISRRLSATEKCLQEHSHGLIFYIYCK